MDKAKKALLLSGKTTGEPTPPPSNWILDGGTWHDSGAWIDTAVWED